MRGCAGAGSESISRRAGMSLTSLAGHREFARALLVQITGAGPRAARRRDQVMQQFADSLDAENGVAAGRGLIPRRASPYDPFAIDRLIGGLLTRGGS